MGEGVKVLGNRGSPYSKRVEIALKLKGISYDYQEEDPYGNKSPELLKSNPVYKKIPVLIHNGKPIAESLVILEYIDEVWEGYPILPKDPYHKATARIWAKFIDDKCLPSLWNALWATNDEEQEKTLKEAKENLEILEKEIKETLIPSKAAVIPTVEQHDYGSWMLVKKPPPRKKPAKPDKVQEASNKDGQAKGVNQGPAVAVKESKAGKNGSRYAILEEHNEDENMETGDLHNQNK
uniref:Glutathione S-transferase n=1 Tax=Chenopodium quinoa TaxID=63459 RepID=A0A803LA76_CHEQI